MCRQVPGSASRSIGRQSSAMRLTETAADGARDAIIDVRGLKTSFTTPLGMLKAVDGVSFSVGASEMLAIVGESGSGKSVTGLSIMRLFGRTGAHIDAGELWFRSSDGAVDLARLDENQMARIRGQEIAIIFQDPMSSLNPVLTIG